MLKKIKLFFLIFTSIIENKNVSLIKVIVGKIKVDATKSQNKGRLKSIKYFENNKLIAGEQYDSKGKIISSFVREEEKAKKSINKRKN